MVGTQRQPCRSALLDFGLPQEANNYLPIYLNINFVKKLIVVILEISFRQSLIFTSMLVGLGPLLVEILFKKSLIFKFLGGDFSLAALQPIKETRLLYQLYQDMVPLFSTQRGWLKIVKQLTRKGLRGVYRVG